MADVVTETNVVQVTLLDAAGYVRTLNLDNPRQNLTLNQIKAVFQPAISGQWLYGRSDVVVDVQKANYSTATKIPIGGGEVLVAPNSYTYSDFSTNPVNFTVSGASPTSAIIEDFSVTVDSKIQIFFQAPEILSDSVRLILNATHNTGTSGTFPVTGSAKLSIFVSGSKIVIPITLNFNLMLM